MHQTDKPKLVQPRTGETHILFGTRTLKFHKFQDPLWTAYDKIAQYDGLIRLHEKDFDLKKLREIAERKQLVEKLKKLRNEVAINRNKLKLALYGNPQEIKNILQNHIDLQIMFANMPAECVYENMDQRTFTKRKELDKLLSKQRKMGDIYKYKLLSFAGLQDRIRYADSKEIKEKFLSKKLRMELKNSETRLRAIRTINHAYGAVINTMMHDEIYYEPTLKALSDDLEEQREFIVRTIRMGKPACDGLQTLQDEYNALENKTRQELQTHISDILAHRELILKNNEIIKKFVRNDSDFTIHPKRYNRETDSMTVIKNRLENLEKVMKEVKKATGCYHSEYIYARLKKQNLNNQQLEDKIVFKEKEKHSLEKRNELAEVRTELLKFDLTDEDISNYNEINGLKRDIEEEKEVQREFENTIKENGEIVCLLRYAFQHFTEVLSHVGEPHAAYKLPYPVSELNLPLLKFEVEAAKIKPPPPLEHDIETLLKITKMKVKLLMEKFNNIDALSPDDQLKAENRFHVDTIDEIAGDGMEIKEPPSLIYLTPPSEDAAVPSRNFIKLMSKKIVEVNAHKED